MRLVIILTVLCSAAMVVPIEARAGALAIDAAGNLFLSDGHSIFKYAPDGTKSTFAAGLNPLGLCFDGEGNLFVVDAAVTEAKSSILKFTPDGKKSTVAKGISPDGMAFDRSGKSGCFSGGFDFQIHAQRGKAHVRHFQALFLFYRLQEEL